MVTTRPALQRRPRLRPLLDHREGTSLPWADPQVSSNTRALMPMSVPGKGSGSQSYILLQHLINTSCHALWAKSVVLRGHLDCADDARSGWGDRRLGSSIRGWSFPRPGGLRTGPGTTAGPGICDAPGTRVRDIPVAGDHGRVLLVEHRVEDRLPGQPRRPLGPARSLDQSQLFRPGWTPQRHGVAHMCHGLMMPTRAQGSHPFEACKLDSRPHLPQRLAPLVPRDW